MKTKSQIEAALERSLRKQVVVPRLDRKFDAGVWARIEAADAPATAPALQAPVSSASAAAARWLNMINILGLASVTIFLGVFGWQMFSGMDISESLPEISAATRESILMNGSTIIATLAVAIGLMFTPLGRKLRDEFG